MSQFFKASRTIWGKEGAVRGGKRYLEIPRFSRTGTASAILNSLNDHVIASFPYKAAHLPGIISGLPVSSRPVKNRKAGKFCFVAYIFAY